MNRGQVRGITIPEVRMWHCHIVCCWFYCTIMTQWHSFVYIIHCYKLVFLHRLCVLLHLLRGHNTSTGLDTRPADSIYSDISLCVTDIVVHSVCNRSWSGRYVYGCIVCVVCVSVCIGVCICMLEHAGIMVTYMLHCASHRSFHVLATGWHAPHSRHTHIDWNYTSCTENKISCHTYTTHSEL